MRNQNYYFYLFFIIITIGCSEKNDTKVEKSIQKIIERFPQLKTGKKTFGNDYKLVKSVKNGEFDFEIQLFSESDSINDKQQIIVLINSKKECSSIPFFNNKYKDYWEFPFDKPIKNVSKITSTFKVELNKALSIFPAPKNHLKDKNLKYEVVNELFQSLLSTENLEEKDSLLIYRTIISNSNLPNEVYDSAFVRLRKNYEKMKSEWHPEDFIYNYNCYFDRRNARIYQVNYNEKTKGYDVKCYRQDWGFTPLNL
ncbi:hypothetical protein [Flavobacterium aquicola]|uniref:Lipoprotein n=1 Tax=Flavobacterium aquicola TaxID=1682742 RepID=A0A3E0E0F7_9FLAO|nr:hypothetical protein [Flavobacterium aquicola]REG91110.1 hypothetical protein C8P67_1172 [Flavobacterium aquicola]